MTENATFASFIRRIRAGDAQAAGELVEQYESVIRKEVRRRLRDSRLRRRFDSLDVCQSVLASFFVRAARGEFSVNQPGQLVRLLVGITRNKVAHAARREGAECRDYRRMEALEEKAAEAAAGDPAPSQVAADRDLLQVLRARLSEEERRLVDLRAQGREWSEIAAEVGGRPETLRKQLARALERVGWMLA
jgi:RNA polymerase sigma-70 factor (ECF subfamily)